MTPEQMIEAQASVMAVDALNAGDEAVRALADNALALLSGLRTATARAEAAERERYAWKQEADDERKSMRSALRVMQERAEAAEARLLALQVDRSKAVKLRDETDNVIWALKPADVPGAINWGDLGVHEIQEVINEERRWWRVIIEEADPSNQALHAAVTAGLVALGWDADDIEIETAW